MKFTGPFGIMVALMVLLNEASWAASNPIGFFTAIQGTVSVTHPNVALPQAAHVNDSVLFKDLIETRQASRMKTLLDDDTILTLGERSRLEITEHVYDPTTKSRSAVLRLLGGKVRALVAKTIGASKFEIHTATAVVAARGTYFVVWVEANGATGVANIGSYGDVALRVRGQEIIVKPGQTSTVQPGSAPPPAEDIGKHQTANDAILATELTSMIAGESTRESLTALGGTVAALGNDLLAPVKPVLNSTATALTGTVSTTTATVPAVVSGALGALNAPYNSVVPSLTTQVQGLAGSVGSVTGLGGTVGSISSITSPLTAPLSTTTTTVTTVVNPLLGPITTLK